MQLDEFRSTLKVRCAKHHTDPDYIPSFMFSRIMESAEGDWSSANGYDRNETDRHGMLMNVAADMFGGYCGWADMTGNVYPFRYATHERFRYCFTPNHREAEQTMAHISTQEASIEDMMSNVKEERYKTKRMVRGILTFCHSVNENVFWHEALLNRLAKDFYGAPYNESIDSARLSKFLHEELPKSHPGGVAAARPYWRLMDVIKTTNEYAQHERDIIKPYTHAEMVARFRPKMWFSNYYEAGLYDHASCMPIAEFQKRLSEIGY